MARSAALSAPPETAICAGCGQATAPRTLRECTRCGGPCCTTCAPPPGPAACPICTGPYRCLCGNRSAHPLPVCPGCGQPMCRPCQAGESDRCLLCADTPQLRRAVALLEGSLE